jgi:uncharacterized protein
MFADKRAAFIEKIRVIDGVTDCALVSRDGIIQGKHFNRDFNESWFGALSATLLASAESAGHLLDMEDLSSVTIQAAGSSLVVMGAGEHFLIAAVLNGTAQKDDVASRICAVAAEIGEVM